MWCLRSRDEQLMDRYIHGRLGDSEQEEFEAHLAECDDCVEQLKLLGTLRTELGQRRAEIESHDAGSLETQWKIWLPLAALLLVGVALIVTSQFASRADFADLVSIEAPQYEPMQFRRTAGEADERFDRAMELYLQGNHEAAIPELQGAIALDPDRPDAPFFLGACELLTDRVDAALGHFDRVIDLDDVQYLEEALYLRAQAHLLRGEAVEASRDLKSIVELGGGWQQRANAQLERIEARLE